MTVIIFSLVAALTCVCECVCVCVCVCIVAVTVAVALVVIVVVVHRACCECMHAQSLSFSFPQIHTLPLHDTYTPSTHTTIHPLNTHNYTHTHTQLYTTHTQLYTTHTQLCTTHTQLYTTHTQLYTTQHTNTPPYPHIPIVHCVFVSAHPHPLSVPHVHPYCACVWTAATAR